MSRDRRLPDFLIIGAQRSGTSWLNKNLSFHPEIWLSPIKELHFFDSYKSKTRAWRRRKYLKNLRRRFLRIVRQFITLDRQLWADLSWDVHYFLGKRNTPWYVKLFRPKPGQVAGEATPAYAVLSLDKIQEIYDINPDMKLIYIMREPLERSWSGATKDLAKKRNRRMEDVPGKEILRKLDFPGAVARSNHVQVLDNWLSIFPKEQFFLAFFEDVVGQPEQLLLRVFEFLGVTASEDFISPSVRKKVNQAGQYKSVVPLEYEIHLAKQQIEQLRELHKRFGGPTNAWLKRAEAILEKAVNSSSR